MPVQILRRLKGWKTSLHRKRAFFRIRFLLTLLLLLFFAIVEIYDFGSFFFLVTFLLVLSDIFTNYKSKPAFVQRLAGSFLKPVIRQVRRFHVLQGCRTFLYPDLYRLSAPADRNTADAHSRKVVVQ